MSEPKTKQAFIVSDITDVNFNDTGTERKFAAGSIEALPEGVFANYEHAGLVREPTQDDKKAAPPAADTKAASPATDTKAATTA